MFRNPKNDKPHPIKLSDFLYPCPTYLNALIQTRTTFRLKHYHPKSEKPYLHDIKDFLRYHGMRPPRTTNLAAPQQVDTLEAWVREQKWGARILRWSLTGLRPSQNSNILLPLILDTNLFQPERYATAAKAMAETTHNHHDPHCHDHHHHSNHLVNDGFVSMAFESDQPFDLDKFQDWLADDLSENVFRAKGFLWFGDITPRYIFQLSGKRYTLDADQWPTDPKTQLVLIGRELDTPKLQNQLRDCLTS